MKTRRIISLTVFLSFIVLAYSGLMLFVSPQGRIAHWAGWSLLGLTKDQYSAVHSTFMVLFLTTGIWHIVLNWRPIVGYLKNRSKQLKIITPESSFALVLTLAFLVGPLAGIPPFKQFLGAGEDIKAYWERTRGAPPWGHAEESRLDVFCRRIVDFRRWEEGGTYVVDCAEAQTALKTAGMEVQGQDQTILDMARENGTTPQFLTNIILSVAREATPEERAAGLAGRSVGGRGVGSGSGSGGVVEGGEAQAGVSQGAFKHPPTGLGRLTLREYSREYGYGLDDLLARLSARHMAVNPDARLREAASELGITPSGIIDALNAGGGGT